MHCSLRRINNSTPKLKRISHPQLHRLQRNFVHSSSIDILRQPFDTTNNTHNNNNNNKLNSVLLKETHLNDHSWRTQLSSQLLSSFSQQQLINKDKNESKNLVAPTQDLSHIKGTGVVIGWLGGKKKHVAKYSEWLSACGFDILATLPPVLGLLSQSSAQSAAKNFVKHLRQVLNEKPISERKLFFHTLSGNGVLFYGYIISELKNNPIEGIEYVCDILDSGPPRINATSFARGFSPLLFPKASASGAIDESSFPFRVVRSGMELGLEKMGVFSHLRSLKDEILNIQPRSPKLFLYSDADKVIPPDEIMEFASEIERSGILTYKKNFIDSEHVQHIRKYPVQYAEQVLPFINNCYHQL